jgi:hypothetical protein
MLIGWRAQSLGKNLKTVDTQRQLAATAAQYRAVHTHEVAEVKRAQPREGVLAEHVHACM